MAADEQVFIGLGSNLGGRLGSIRFGVERIKALANSEEVVISPVYESEPWGGVKQETFLNCVVQIKTEIEPIDLLAELKKIEREAGRTADLIRWGARELDLDILLFGERRIESSELTIPHPYLTERRFALTPLNDLISGAYIPGHNLKVGEALRYVNDLSWIKLYSEGISL